MFFHLSVEVWLLDSTFRGGKGQASLRGGGTEGPHVPRVQALCTEDQGKGRA